VDVSLASAGTAPAGLQWTFDIPASVSASAWQAGPALTAAGKTLSCGAASSGKQKCLASGTNSNAISAGLVARATLSLTASAATSPLTLSGVLGVSATGTSIQPSSLPGTLTVSAPAAPVLSTLACTPATFTAPAVAACTVTLSGPVSAATPVTLQSSAAAVTVPASVTIAAGSASAAFNATASSAVPAAQTVTVSATLGTATKSAALSLQPAAAVLSGIACTPNSVASGATAACSVTLSAAAPAGGTSLSISSSSSALSLPTQLAIPAGATSASVTATAGPVTADQAVTVTATLGGTAKSATVTVTPAAVSGILFHLKGESGELPAGAANGAAVAPTVIPAGLTGTLLRTGAGSADFLPARTGNGLSFKQGGSQNKNSAFLRFRGANVKDVFGGAKGDITFYLKSTRTFAERKTRLSWVFDVYDASARKFSFSVNSVGSRLHFLYQLAGSSLKSYTVPAGSEEAVFGKDAVAKVRLAWDGAAISFYLNDTLAQTTPHSGGTANWSTKSTFMVGASGSTVDSGAGFYSFDDVVDEFIVSAPASSAAATAPAGVSAVTCTPSTLTSASTAQCAVTLTSPAPAGGTTAVLTANNPALTAPASLDIPAGATSATFTVSAASPIVAAGTAVVNATVAQTSGACSLTLTPPAGAFTPIRVNAGGPAYVDSKGQTWKADNAGGSTYTSTRAVAAPADATLYATERYSTAAFQYQYPVPNGNYNVRLKFAEIWFTSPDQRVFNVEINGRIVLANYDPAARAGASFKAVDEVVPVTVTGGSITIRLVPVVSTPKISAFEITAP
jgi:hypothetical protein